MIAAEKVGSRKETEEALWLCWGIARASVLPRTTGDVVIDASRKSVYRKAYLASTKSYFDAVYVLSATSGEPDCSEALRVSRQARAWCEASLAALEEHKLKGETTEIQGMAPEEACSSDMLVLIQWQGQTMAVPLSQLQPIKENKATNEATTDWHYWVAQGYCF
jgi:hypothetical protein